MKWIALFILCSVVFQLRAEGERVSDNSPAAENERRVAGFYRVLKDNHGRGGCYGIIQSLASMGTRDEALLLMQHLESHKDPHYFGGSEQCYSKLEIQIILTDALAFMLGLPRPELPFRRYPVDPTSGPMPLKPQVIIVLYWPLENLNEYVLDEFLERCQHKVQILSMQNTVLPLQELSKVWNRESPLVDYLAQRDNISSFSLLLTLIESNRFSDATRSKAVKALHAMRANEEVLALIEKAANPLYLSRFSELGKLGFIFSIKEPPPSRQSQQEVEEFLEKCLQKMINIQQAAAGSSAAVH
ncbi:MAG TPA: hypothetical protein VK970_11315 [Candidatus Methylacidiphilales bacterium]|nr:hypothetical protein [Candidatus Methylacidiphilales bacterium]